MTTALRPFKTPATPVRGTIMGFKEVAEEAIIDSIKEEEEGAIPDFKEVEG